LGGKRDIKGMGEGVGVSGGRGGNVVQGKILGVKPSGAKTANLKNNQGKRNLKGFW